MRPSASSAARSTVPPCFDAAETRTRIVCLQFLSARSCAALKSRTGTGRPHRRPSCPQSSRPRLSDVSAARPNRRVANGPATWVHRRGRLVRPDLNRRFEMRRFIGPGFALFISLLVVLLAGAASVAAAGPSMPHTGRVLVSVNGDVTLPGGEQADTIVVVRGHAEILGSVHTLVVVEGSATLTGATLETVTAIRSPVTLNA